MQELAKRVNLMPLWLQRIEQYDWDRSSFGLDFDMKLAEALGVHITDVFPHYAPPKKQPEPQPKPDPRTPEERERDFAEFKAHWEEKQKPPNIEQDRCHYTQTQEGVWEGEGCFAYWQHLQKKRESK